MIATAPNSLEIVLDLLETSRRTAASFNDSYAREIRDEQTTDISTRADRALSQALVTRASSLLPGAAIWTEESGKTGSEEPDLIVAIDDLDGTDNFFHGWELMPWCTVVAILRGPQPRFSDVLAAGIIEHRSGILWAASAEGEAFEQAPGGGWRPLSVSAREKVDRRTLVFVDHYTARGGTVHLAGIHEQAWVKDFGSSAFHLACVASGRAEAFVNPVHKAHELAAGYLLVTAAGGCILDFEGHDLGSCPFDFIGTYPIIAAGTPAIASELMKLRS